MRELLRRRSTGTLIAALVASAFFWSSASPAWAYSEAQSVVYWSFDAPQGAHSRNVDQVVNIKRTAPSTFWALYWSFLGGPDGGYVGLQTDGNRFDGSNGPTAIFSLWNANGSRNGSGRCGAFGHEGVGLSCRGTFPISTSVYYRYRVDRLSADSKGQWWGAWIYDPGRSINYHIGDIRVPQAAHSQINLANVSNFSEYFGPTLPCNQVPLSTAFYTQPAANRNSGNVYDYYSHFGTFLQGSCVTARLAQVTGTWTGTVLYQGGTG